MKGQRTLIGMLAVGLGLLLILVTGLALAQGPGVEGEVGIQAALGTAFTYQGHLTDGGSPANGTYDLEFKLYDAASNGNQVGSTVAKDDVAVTDGLFTVELDFGSGVFTGDARYLEIGVRPGTSVGAYTTLLPRQALTPAPYALALPGLWTQQNATSPNLIGGYSSNSVTAGVEGATIGGGGASGYTHRVTDDYGTVSGGRNNQAGDNDSTISDAHNATVGGGEGNTAGSSYATVGGGLSNAASAPYATAGGGGYNSANGWAATVGGGDGNHASGQWATVPGGRKNAAQGYYSFAAGRRAKANHQGAFVWADSTEADFASTTNNQFAVRANGGVVFSTGGASFRINGGDAWTSTNDGSGSGLDADLLDGQDGSYYLDWNNLTNVPAGFADGVDNTGAGGDFWSLAGNAGTTSANFLGTTDNQALELRVNSARALRLEPNADSPNFIGGYSGNSVTSGVVGATISGGGTSDFTNRVTDNYGTVAGGDDNQAGDDAGTTDDAAYATVGGGLSNTASAPYATVGGGFGNVITGTASSATIGGGYSNEASGGWATVGGGASNVVTGTFATVGGGVSNIVSDDHATVSGGIYNIASGGQATVGGGWNNTASGENTTVAGGELNTASGNHASVGGGFWNTASGDFVTISGGEYISVTGRAATVAGGSYITATRDYAAVGGGSHNTASAPYATIGGGEFNTASGYDATVGGGNWNEASGGGATVGGGDSNIASRDRATVGGGSVNTASGMYATVPGGYGNTAQGDYSFAAGNRAKANHDGAFVWADSNGFDFSNTWPNEFTARATGGFYFVTALDAFGNPSAAAWLPSGSGTWLSLSDRNVKTNFTPVDGREILAHLAAIPIETWNYKTQDSSIRHIGPVAQDFYAAFSVGEDDRHISTVDADGVALAAIQGLYELVQEKDGQITALEAEVSTLHQQNTDLEARVVALEQAVGASPSSPSNLPGGWWPLFLGGLVVAAGVVVQRRQPGGGR